MKNGKSDKTPVTRDGSRVRDYTCEQLCELLVNSVPKRMRISYSQGPLTVHPQLVHRVIDKNKCAFCPLLQFRKVNKTTLYYAKFEQIPYTCEDCKITY